MALTAVRGNVRQRRAHTPTQSHWRLAVGLSFAEEATITAFVVSAKRDRLLGLLSSRKRRKQAVGSLNHFADWDSRYVHPLSPSADILMALERVGAPKLCHVISDAPSIDGREMPLVDAIAAAEVFPFASLLCCVPGRVACFFDEAEAPRRRLLLCRARGRTRVMELIIHGWKPGLKTISLMDVLRQSCGMDLKQAKEAVDGLLDGRPIRVSGLAEEAAAIVRKEAEKLGAICQ